MTDSQEVEQRLLDLFNQSFTREALEKNPYYAYKLTQNLSLQLEDIYNENSVKHISTNKDIILSALGKCELLKVHLDQNIVILALQSKENVLVAQSANSNLKEFQQFIQGQLQAKSLNEEAIVENNSVSVNFQDKSEALDFSTHLSKTEFNGSKIDVQLDYENIQMKIQQAVVEYKKKKKGYSATQNGQQENPEAQEIDPQQQALLYQQQYQQAILQQQAMYSQQAMFQSPNFHHVYSPKDYSDLYIRKARHDDKKKRGNQQYDAQTLAYMQQYAYMNQYYAYSQYAYQQQPAQQKGKRSQDNKQERQNNHQRSDKNQKKRKDSREKNPSKKGKKQDNNKSQPPKNRPRIDSENFPVLTEVDDKGSKQTVQYLQKPQKPKASAPQVPYSESRTKIDKQYSKFEILTSFERWKLAKNMNSQLTEFQGNSKIPVLSKTPIIKLEVEQPYRKNSSSVTPLLKPIPAHQYRKGSAQHFKNPSLSPNPNRKTRKFSSQK